MKRTILLLTVVTLLFGAVFVVAPAAAQGQGEVNVTLTPDQSTVEVGQNQTFEVVVQDPDGGVLAYDNLNISVDPTVAEITAFRENHTSSFSNSNITDDGSELNLAASAQDDLSGSAVNHTLVEFDVKMTAGGSTTVGFDKNANATITDFNDTNSYDAYTILSLSNATLAAQDSTTFQVSNLQPPDQTVTNGTAIDVSADIENVGTAGGTQDITLRIENSTGTEVLSRTQSQQLNAGANTTVTFSNVDTGAFGPGEYTRTISSANDSASGTLTVQEPANFSVAIDSTNSPVVEGETLSVTATVTNTGDEQGTQTVDLSVGTLGTNSTSVTLSGGASSTETLTVGTTSGDAGSFTATVSSANDSASRSVTVQEPANFSVSIDSTNSPVVEGETLSVTATVTNTGDVQGTQTVVLDVGTLGSNSTSVNLGGGASSTETLSVGTASGDAGSFTATVSSANDSASQSVTVQEPANFSVAIDSTNSPVVEGETLSVTATVTNTGDLQGTQTVELDVGVLGTNSTSLTLSSGANTTETFSVATASGDAGSFTATVSSENDSATQSVTVQEPANFSVAIDSTNSPVVEGETLSVTATVTNVGDVQGSGVVDLNVGAVGANSTGVTLASGASESVTLSVQTASGDAGSFTASFFSQNDSETTTVTVQEPANFSVAIDSTNSPVVEGESLSVTANVTNTGDVQGTQTVDLSVGALGSNSTSVTLSGGASSTETLTVGTASGDAGSFTATVSSANDSASQSVAVQEPANFSVAIDSTNSPVVEGESLSVTATVTNTGDVQGTQSLSLSVGSLGTNSTSVNLASGANTTETLTVSTASGDAGSFTATVSSANDSASTGVAVNAPANFSVTIDSTNAPVVEGETLSVTTTITNVGDTEGTQTISLSVGTIGSDSVSVTLPSGANTTETLSVATASGDAGDFTATVSSSSDSASQSVTVQAPANFSVAITNVPSAVTEGETVTVEYNVTNTGDLTDTQNITFTVNGTNEGTESDLLLNGSETFAGQFSYVTGAGDVPQVSVTVSSENSSASRTVTVNEPPNFDVTITDVPSAVAENKSLTVDYEVTNTGDLTDTQNIAFTVNGTNEGTESDLLLNGSETFAGQFSYVTNGSDVPQVTVAVSSENSSASATVAVDKPANFDVTTTEINSTVTEGETVLVDYQVTNTGNLTATQNITFTVNGTTEATETGVTLNESETFAGQFSYQTVTGDAPAVSVAVSSNDSTASNTVTVNEPANFEVTITSAPTAVTEGETVTVAYEVTNTGDLTDTQDIGFTVNGTSEGTESGLTLNGSETFAGQFDYTTDASDDPQVSVAVSSENSSASQTVTVNEPANFEVTIPSVPTAVTENDTIVVGYEVTNTGDLTDTQNIDFTVNGTSEGTETVTLNGSETFAGQFSYVTGAGDVPQVTVAVSSNNDTASDTVTVNEPANFEVTITSVNSSVTENETIIVGYEVTNTGDLTDTQNIDFTVNGTSEGTETVTLNGGETFAGQFSYVTGAGDDPQVSVAVSSENDTASSTVTVNEPANFEVTITSVPTAVTEGETVTVEYNVTNTGDLTDTQDIGFTVNGTGEGTETGLTLNGSETFAGQFSYVTGAGDVPQVTVAVSSENDTASDTVTVNEPANFEVTITSVPTAVTEGETVTVAYEVTNTGDLTDTQNITFTVNGTNEGTETGLTLNGSETFAGQFDYTTGAGDVPQVSVAVSSKNDTASNTVTVNEPANFEVTITSVPTAVTEGETVTVAYEVTNTGDVQATQDISFTVNGTSEGTETVTLNGGETFASQFDYTTGAGDVPQVSVAVSSENSSASQTVTVNEPANFEVTITSAPTAVTEGETVTVAYEVTNTGDLTDTQDIGFTVNGTTEATETVTLNGGETFAGQFDYTTGASDDPQVSVAVSSENSSASQTVTVNEPANFEVTTTSVNSSVTENETIVVGYEVTNTGDLTDTQDIGFTVNGTGEGTEAGLTLTQGETFTSQFSYVTGAGDVPQVTVAVSSNNDTASDTVVVSEQGSPPEFRVTNIDPASATVTNGTAVDISAFVDNVGSLNGTQDITLSIENSTNVEVFTRTKQDVSRDANQNASVTFASVDTGVLGPGSYTHTISSANDSASGSLTVQTPADFGVTNIDPASATVTNGTALDISAFVENTGDSAGTQNVTLSIENSAGAEVFSQTRQDLTRTAGENASVTFASVDTGALGPGSYTHTISSANDSASGSLTVEPSSQFGLGFSEQSIESGTVTVENVFSGGVEAAVVVTYQDASAGGTGLVVAGQTVGTFDGGDVAVTLEDTSALGENHTAHILPASDLSNSTETSGVVSSVTADAIEASAEAFVSVEVSNGEFARDTTGDGRLNNVRGEDGFNTLDVQALFDGLDTPAVENNAAKFNFLPADNEVNILDVQALFNQLPGR